MLRRRFLLGSISPLVLAAAVFGVRRSWSSSARDAVGDGPRGRPPADLREGGRRRPHRALPRGLQAECRESFGGNAPCARHVVGVELGHEHEPIGIRADPIRERGQAGQRVLKGRGAGQRLRSRREGRWKRLRQERADASGCRIGIVGSLVAGRSGSVAVVAFQRAAVMGQDGPQQALVHAPRAQVI
jgi:hypothetical protein